MLFPYNGTRTPGDFSIWFRFNCEIMYKNMYQAGRDVDSEWIYSICGLVDLLFIKHPKLCESDIYVDFSSKLSKVELRFCGQSGLQMIITVICVNSDDMTISGKMRLGGSSEHVSCDGMKAVFDLAGTFNQYALATRRGIEDMLRNKLSPEVRMFCTRVVDKGLVFRNIALDPHCIEHYAVEECAELTKELTKHLRGNGDRESTVEEMADVYYVLSCLASKFDVTEDEINGIIKAKERKASENVQLLEQMAAANKMSRTTDCRPGLGKKAMLSQPMAGKTQEEIVATRNRAIAYLEGQGYEVVNTLFTDEWYSSASMEKRGVVNKPMCFLAKSLESMSQCDAVYFCKGWREARGCRLEHDAAQAYGVRIMYECTRVESSE